MYYAVLKISRNAALNEMGGELKCKALNVCYDIETAQKHATRLLKTFDKKYYKLSKEELEEFLIDFGGEECVYAEMVEDSCRVNYFAIKIVPLGEYSVSRSLELMQRIKREHK